MYRPIEQSTSGQRPLILRMGHLPPNKQSGPKRSAIECDSKQVKSKLTEHTKRERKNDSRSTYREKEKDTSLKKERSYWKTKTNGETRHPFSE